MKQFRNLDVLDTPTAANLNEDDPELKHQLEDAPDFNVGTFVQVILGRVYELFCTLDNLFGLVSDFCLKISDHLNHYFGTTRKHEIYSKEMTAIEMPIIFNIINFKGNFKNNFSYCVIPGVDFLNRGCSDYIDAQRKVVTTISPTAHSQLH